jgi:hypothetical protein
MCWKQASFFWVFINSRAMIQNRGKIYEASDKVATGILLHNIRDSNVLGKLTACWGFS